MTIDEALTCNQKRLARIKYLQSCCNPEDAAWEAMGEEITAIESLLDYLGFFEIEIHDGIQHLIDEKNFAFSVEALGNQWSVYRFTKGGRKGMLAFRQTEPPSVENPHGKWEIGFFKAGEFTPEQVFAALVHGQS